MRLFLILVLVLPLNAFADKPEQFIGFSFPMGAPHIVNLEAEGAFNKSFSFGLGGVKTPSIIIDQKNNIGLGLSNIQATTRWHPFSGAFFIGNSLGWHALQFSSTQNFTVSSQTVPTTITGTLSALYATPHLGWFWIVGKGFTFGLDLGATIPFSSSSSIDYKINDSTLQSLLDTLTGDSEFLAKQAEITDDIEKYGRYILPYVVIRLGWSF